MFLLSRALAGPAGTNGFDRRKPHFPYHFLKQAPIIHGVHTVGRYTSLITRIRFKEREKRKAPSEDTLSLPRLHPVAIIKRPDALRTVLPLSRSPLSGQRTSSRMPWKPYFPYPARPPRSALPVWTQKNLSYGPPSGWLVAASLSK